MAQYKQSSGYTQGYSESTVATHLLRTAESEAAFLVPYIKKTDRILDVGCGPGTITTSLAKYASAGTTVGIDISAAVLQKAKKLAAEVNTPTEGPGSVTFEEGNILKQLRFDDNSFDIVYASQVFGHLPLPELPLTALKEIRRVLRPGGILATRDGTVQNFYPSHFELDRLWGENLVRVVNHGAVNAQRTATAMPALFRQAGFDTDGGNVRVGASAVVYSTPEARKWLAARATGQLKPGDPFYQSWLDAGISETEIQETLRAATAWADTQDAWLVAVQCEMLAWK